MVELKNVCFTYAGERTDAGVKNVSLTISKGEVVLLCGRSGCGKTTLTRLINGLIPHYYEGTLTGSVAIKGCLVADMPLYNMAGMVGSVFQNPRSQFFNVDTDSELAFACENLGMPEEKVHERIAQTVDELELEPLLGHSIFELSGGEKQKIACGSVSTLKPDILVLDEPTSNLDMEGINMLQKVIRHWKAEGRTIIIAEHRLHFLAGLADRVIYLENGVISKEYVGAAFFRQPVSFYRERGLRIPNIDDLWQAEEEQPYSQNDCFLRNFCYSYKKGNPVLDIPEAKLPMGQATAIIGKNGAGKTTLMRSICGLLKHDKGIFDICGNELRAKNRLSYCYLVMQDVNHQLFTESVLDEVLLSMKGEDVAKAEKILKSLDLLGFKELHPMSLSGGQKQRVAIASALAGEWEVLVFDEPTSGLDFSHMQQVADNIRTLTAKNKTVFVVTHDPEFIRACCSYVLHIEHGQVRDSYPLDKEGIKKLKTFFMRNPNNLWKGGDE